MLSLLNFLDQLSLITKSFFLNRHRMPIIDRHLITSFIINIYNRKYLDLL